MGQVEPVGQVGAPSPVVGVGVGVGVGVVVGAAVATPRGSHWEVLVGGVGQCRSFHVAVLGHTCFVYSTRGGVVQTIAWTCCPVVEWVLGAIPPRWEHCRGRREHCARAVCRLVQPQRRRDLQPEAFASERS